MIRSLSSIVTVVVFSLSSCLYSAGLFAQDPVRAGFVNSIPPYVMAERGIFVDLVEEALQRAGLSMQVITFPSRRFDEDPFGMFEEMDIFVGTPITFRNDYYYLRLFQFDNVAVSMKTKGFKIKQVEDLKGKSIVAFNNAREHLKEPFRSFYNSYLVDWPEYLEIENQYSQFGMLVQDHTDVILLDRYMVYHYAREYGIDSLAQLEFHEIFSEKNDVYVVGRNREFIELIDHHLEQMLIDGWTSRMLEAYQ